MAAQYLTKADLRPGGRPTEAAHAAIALPAVLTIPNTKGEHIRSGAMADTLRAFQAQIEDIISTLDYNEAREGEKEEYSVNIQIDYHRNGITTWQTDGINDRQFKIGCYCNGSDGGLHQIEPDIEQGPEGGATSKTNMPDNHQMAEDFEGMSSLNDAIDAFDEATTDLLAASKLAVQAATLRGNQIDVLLDQIKELCRKTQIEQQHNEAPEKAGSV